MSEKLTVRRLRDLLINLMNAHPETADKEVRVADVVEGSDLHCSVGGLVLRGGSEVSLIVVHGKDDVWRDETIATDASKHVVWGEDG